VIGGDKQHKNTRPFLHNFLMKSLSQTKKGKKGKRKKKRKRLWAAADCGHKYKNEDLKTKREGRPGGGPVKGISAKERLMKGGRGRGHFDKALVGGISIHG